MLGVSQVRTATIYAETVVCCWEITSDRACPMIESYPHMQTHFRETILQHLDHTISRCMDLCPLFLNFDRKFRMLLGLYSKRKAFFGGEAIFTEGRVADGLSIIGCGECVLSQKGVEICRLKKYGHFNSTVMLGLHRKSLYSLTSLRTSHVIIIDRESYLMAVEQYPHQNAAQELKASEERSYQEFVKRTHKLIQRRMVKRRQETKARVTLELETCKKLEKRRTAPTHKTEVKCERVLKHERIAAGTSAMMRRNVLRVIFHGWVASVTRVAGEGQAQTMAPGSRLPMMCETPRSLEVEMPLKHELRPPQLPVVTKYALACESRLENTTKRLTSPYLKNGPCWVSRVSARRAISLESTSVNDGGPEDLWCSLPSVGGGVLSVIPRIPSRLYSRRHELVRPAAVR